MAYTYIGTSPRGDPAGRLGATNGVGVGVGVGAGVGVGVGVG